MNSVCPINYFSDDIYSMVKSFVIRGNLIDTSLLEGLAESKSLSDLLLKLRGTVYSDVVSSLQSPYSISSIEVSLRKHLVNTHNKILSVTPKNDILIAYYLKYIGYNLKILLKGRVQGKSEQSISEHLDMYAEEIFGRRDMLIKALSSENIENTVDVLKDSEFGTDVISALNLYKKSGNSQVFDIFIDKAFYQNVLNAFMLNHKKDTYVRDIVSLEIDSYNCLAVLRSRLWNLESSEIKKLIIPHFFDISEGVLNNMIESESINESIKILHGTIYRKILIDTLSNETAITVLEDEFRILSYRRAYNPFLWDINRISIALGAIKLTELETHNLSAIAFGIENHLGTKEIMSSLVILK